MRARHVASVHTLEPAQVEAQPLVEAQSLVPARLCRLGGIEALQVRVQG